MRVGALCYASQQGLGYLMKQFFDNGLVTDPVVFRHSSPKRPTHLDWYPPGTLELVGRPFDGDHLDRVVRSVDVMLFFETPFDWSVIDYCRRRKVTTILMPMYEWTPVTWPVKPDALVCPSVLDADYFRDEFPDGMCQFIPVPVETKYWKRRTTATRFLHNAGGIGHREHKGTRQLLEAIPYVKNPDFRITVRAQDVGDLTRMMGQMPDSVMGDQRLSVEPGAVPYETLWDDHDVLVAPEKFNGLSLPLQEARAAGMLVMTTDRYPTNTWLPKGPLIPADRTQRARVGGSYREFDECVVAPETIAKAMDIWYGEDISAYSDGGRRWAENHSWPALKPAYLEYFESVVRRVRG